MAGDSPFVRLTVDQLASLVDRLSVRNRSLDDKSRWTWNPPNGQGGLTTAPQLILPVSFYRRGLVFSVTTNGPVQLGNFLTLGTGSGVQLTINTNPFPFWYDDVGAAVCANWYATSSAPGSVISWLELVAPSQIK